ncbi:MAG TPA: hypothetical protein PKD78_08165, partial [Saprospiraceae bacterium]|nr:hypothetical protein [Saprospiraceae bacterium]
MNTFCRIILACLIVLAAHRGQAQSDCQRLLDEAAQYERNEQYDRALKKYLSAKEECDPKVSARVNTLILNVFDKIQRQKRDADDAKKAAEDAAKAARRAEMQAKAAQAKAERSAKSNQLVALSLTKQNQDPTLSLQLAAMAWQLGVDSATGMCTEAGASAVLRDISSDPTNWFYLPFKGHRGRVSCVAFSPDGTQVVTGGEDQTIRFWNLKGRPVDTLLGHTGPVNSIQFSADKKWMASVSLDSTVRIWGLDGKPLHVLRHSSFVEAVRMPRKSKLLLTTCTDTIWAWDVETGARQQGWALHEEGAADVVFSTTDSLMATVRGGRVKLWTQGGRFIDSLFRGKYIERVRFDPQGRYIVGAGNNTIYRISRSALHQVDSLLSDTGTGFFHLSADGGWVFWGGMYSHVWYCSLEEFKAPHYFSYEGGMAVSRGSLNSGMQFLGGENLC